MWFYSLFIPFDWVGGGGGGKPDITNNDGLF